MVFKNTICFVFYAKRQFASRAFSSVARSSDAALRALSEGGLPGYTHSTLEQRDSATETN